MPKRVLSCHLKRTKRLKSVGCAQEDANGKDDTAVEPPKKQKTFSRVNRNHELERLLLYNSRMLYFHVDHCNFPFFNVGLWPPKENEALNTYPSMAFAVPQPIYVADKHCDKVDLCFKRVINKESSKNRLIHSKIAYNTAHKKKKVLRTSEKDGIYHTSVFDLAERYSLQPDIFFNKSYDHYYTGGNLNSLPQCGKIIHAVGEKLKTLAVSEFPATQGNATIRYLQNLAAQTSTEDSEIFEISPLLTSPDSSRQNSFIARQRNLVTFNYINENNEIKTISQFRTKTTPFISFAQSERERDNFIITTMKQHVRLYDLGQSVPTLVKLYEISPDISWNQVKPWRENTFLYASEKQFLLIDTRTTPEQWLETVISADGRSECDHISSILPSDFNNLFYVATSHKLHCMDIRYLEKNAFTETHGAICRWSHQLRYPPLMMDTFRLRQSEFVALSSPIAGDLHICELTRERNTDELKLEPSQLVPKHIYSSACLPYQPPTLFEAYENARLAGKCLKPEANLEARLKCCTTGLTFYQKADSAIPLLLTSNSNGDVFAQGVSKREKAEKESCAGEIRFDANSDEIMAEFERKICDQTQLPLNFTEIRNMRSLRKIFLCNSLSTKPKYDFDAMADEYSDSEEQTMAAVNEINTTTEAPRRKRLHLGRWQKSVSTLYSYKDALTPDLLSIWDVEDEKEKNIRLDARLHVKAEPSDMVAAWLNKNVTPNPPPMLSIPTQQIAGYNGSSSTIQNIEDIYGITQTQNTTIDFENAVHSTQIMDNTAANVLSLLDTSCLELQIQDATKTTILEKKKKKSKKYIKGF